MALACPDALNLDYLFFHSKVYSILVAHSNSDAFLNVISSLSAKISLTIYIIYR